MDSISCLSKIPCDVSQGSMLAPLLFIICVNDICQSSDLFSFVLYADDTNVLSTNKDFHVLFQEANVHLSKAFD